MNDINTPHCRIRAMEPSDVEHLYRWENDPEIWRIGANTETIDVDRESTI